MIGRRTLLQTSAAVLLATPATAAAGIDWKALGEDVRAEMAWAWGQYREKAFGRDQIRPISGGYESFPLKDHHLGFRR